MDESATYNIIINDLVELSFCNTLYVWVKPISPVDVYKWGKSNCTFFKDIMINCIGHVFFSDVN